jgi:hypothetical protein
LAALAPKEAKADLPMAAVVVVGAARPASLKRVAAAVPVVAVVGQDLAEAVEVRASAFSRISPPSLSSR